MGRVHLFEFADQPWFPRTLRAAGTEYLRVVMKLVGAEKTLAPLVARAIEDSRSAAVVDLCSGSGGPWGELGPLLGERGLDVPVTLTDHAPTVDGMRRVDASRVPPELRGLRTIFNGFHHFDRDGARAVLTDAIEAGQPIAIYELSERTAVNAVGALLIPLMVWLTGPLLRPVRASWLLLIYLLPVLPLVIAWDGFVSHLRVWSLPELETLTADLDGFTWEMGRERAGALRVTWLHGRPA